MQLLDLIAGLDIEPDPLAAGSLDLRICDITEDSRTAMPGSLFIARRGARADGRAFISAAVAAGAVAVLTDEVEAPLVAGGRTGPPPALLRTRQLPLNAAIIAERFHGEPTSRLTLAGITGTKGKSTVASLIHQLLNRAGIRCGLIGTVCIDDGSEVTPASLTTPPAIELSRTMARMLDCGCRAAVMEASSHALHQHRVSGLHFRIGIFTNLTRDHLDYHGTMDAYAEAKAALFASLPDEPRGGHAIVNALDPFARRMVRDCRARVWACMVTTPGSAMSEALRHPAHLHADCVAEVRRADAAGSDVLMTGPWGRWELRLPLVGMHNALNALQAAAAALAMGLSPAEIASGLTRVSAPPGRLEPVSNPGDPFAVYVDYAHTDDSLRTILRVARSITSERGTGGRVLAVFGCGGDRDRGKRPLMGAAAVEGADAVFVTSDNPRTEDPSAIIDEILTGVPAAARPRVVIEPDRQRAIHAAVRAARPGDVVIIAGKGHEDYQIVADGRGGTVKRRFDDREVAREALLRAGIGVVARSRGSAGSAPRSTSDRTRPEDPGR
ncbi:MAG: UDP-N-acetylmuramoyl-L-alanyl-D-glutamate--2,6-diaminopimelate ligase [Phycisphaerales bacterium]